LPTSELIGCAVAVCAASGLLCGLLWIAGSSRGIPPSRLRRMLLQALGAGVVGLAGLGLARWLTGSSLLDLDRHSATGLYLRPLSAAQAATDAAAAIWALVCLWYALSLASRITGPPPSRTTPPDPGK
jgi:hypothetical protein